MSQLFFTTLYVLLPAYIANMAPVIAHRLNVFPRLNKPIDRGAMFFGQRVFGSTKTWRGMVVGVSSAMFVGTIQFFLWQFEVIRIRSIIDFSVIDPLTFGFFGGVGALSGDLIKSFFKRRFKIPSSNPWPVFDQLDFILGYVATTSLFIHWDARLFVSAIILTLIVHPLTNVAAYFLSVKKVWW